MDTLISIVATTVQYDKDWANHLTVADMCAQLHTAAATGTAALDKQYAELSGFTDAAGIDASFMNDVNEMRSHTPGDAGQSWTWQTCNEFGYYQTSDGPRDKTLLPENSIELSYFTDICDKGFGIDARNVAGRVDDTNAHYGKTDIWSSNIFFNNNSEDPWHNLGLVLKAGQTTLPHCTDCPVTWTVATAHCASMYAPRATDLPALKATRAKIVQTLDRWLK